MLVSPLPFFKKRRRRFFYLHRILNIALSPSGEIGRHSGLKIRRYPEKGRTGSIPVSGTNLLFYPVSHHLKTRMLTSIAGFLLSYAISPDTIAAQRNTVTFDGILKTAEMRYRQRGQRGTD